METNMTLSQELKARGLLAQLTDEKEISELIDNGKATFYIGFDPTADSLHVGHFMALLLMKRMQERGNKPIALVGGGTAMIGDPSGRSDMRKMMTIEQIDHNCDCFKKQMSRFIDFGPGQAQMVNNADWLRDLNFLEFSYMLMQSYDFYRLYQDYGCQMQFGGDDQWSNMLGGANLIRKKLQKDAYAMTITLLLKHDGTKMGKTSGGAVWLNPDKTSPYDFYQYWRNVDDADVLKFLRMMTFLPLEQIDEMDKWEGSQLNEAKKILAHELTTLVHGDEEAKKAEAGAQALFGGAGITADSENLPEAELHDEDFMEDGTIDILGILVKGGFEKSRNNARTSVQQGGVTVNDEKVTDLKQKYSKEELKDGILVRRGKKTFKKVLYR